MFEFGGLEREKFIGSSKYIQKYKFLKLKIGYQVRYSKSDEYNVYIMPPCLIALLVSLNAYTVSYVCAVLIFR